MLTGWKSVRTFQKLWEYINGGENDWTSRCNHFREGIDASRHRESRPHTRSLSMADAFFMHQFIMKQDVDFACAAYLFGVSPASASRYMISMSAILDEFLNRKFPRMKASDVYATQPPSFKDVFGMPVHSIIDGTEIPMESSLNEYTRATTYSQYKGQTTVKFNVGLAANGLIDYISEGISGSTSDKKMCTNHGHLEWMKTMENAVEFRTNCVASNPRVFWSISCALRALGSLTRRSKPCLTRRCIITSLATSSSTVTLSNSTPPVSARTSP